MDAQEYEQRKAFQIRHYETLSAGEIHGIQEHTVALPERLSPLLRNVREIEQDGTYYSPCEMEEQRLEHWQLAKDESGVQVRLPAADVIRESTYNRFLAQRSSNQKQNEQNYREEIRRVFQTLKEGMPEHDDDAEFLDLAENKRAIAANSEAYNRVLQAAEKFCRGLLRGDLEEGKLVGDAEELYRVCTDYIEGHPSPFFQRGKDRRQLVLALQKKAEDIREYERDRGRNGVFCAANVLEQKGGEKRRDKLIDTVEAVIQSWSGKGDDVLVASIKTSMLGDREEIAKRYLHYFFSDHAFKSYRRDESYQMEVLANMEESRLAPRIQKFMSAIDETMGDILFWAGKLKATSVSGIELTGSDLHERGIGVILVTYQTGAGEQEKVLKPEEKWAEYGLLRKTPADEAAGGRESVAEHLNRLVREGKVGVRQPEGGFLPLNGEIRTIDLQIAQGHGTMVERVKHVQRAAVSDLAKEKLPRAGEQEEAAGREAKIGEREISQIVDAEQMLLSQIFCMLTGMGDMHHENFVYVKSDEDETAKYHAVMIDADNALSAQIMGKEDAGGQRGMLHNYLAGQTVVIDGIEQLADQIETNLSGAVLRTVPIETEALEGNRATVQTYSNISEILQKIRDMQPGDLKSSIEGIRHPEQGASVDEGLRGLLQDRPIIVWYGNVFAEGCGQVLEHATITPEQEKNVLIWAIEDFMEGQIPFYEFHPQSGEVTTHRNIVVATADKVRDMKGKMIAPFRRNDAEPESGNS